jgi:lipoprotein NlpI
MRTLAALLVLAAPIAAADDPKEAEKAVDEASRAFEKRNYAAAVEWAAKAQKLDPKNATAPFVEGLAHDRLRQNAEALKALSRAIALDPNNATAIDRRGDANLKLGKFADAVADFDKFLQMRPKYAPKHWRRGIALYYAGKFDDGRKQFELHRTDNPEDVENAAWHYLCNARATNPATARKELIPVKDDTRVPMKQVLELFAGKIKPQDVLDAAEKAKLSDEARTEARFYAHQYVALYYESEGDAKKALEHLATAVEKYKIGHYMWDVGYAHLMVLKGKK